MGAGACGRGETGCMFFSTATGGRDSRVGFSFLGTLRLFAHVDDDDNVSLSICLLEHTLTHACVNLGVSLVVCRSSVKARLG